MWLELESGRWSRLLSVDHIAPSGPVRLGRYSHSTFFWAENHEKYMAVCILTDRLRISLYQTNSHNNSVRKNVRGLAVMGMLLCLLHKFGLDLLSPGNLAEHVPAISKW